MENNLKNVNQVHETPWNLQFGIVCEKLQNRINAAIFYGNNRPMNLDVIFNLATIKANEVFLVINRILALEPPPFPMTKSVQARPPQDFVKLNTDASVISGGHLAFTRGLIHNSKRHWITSFVANLGKSSMLHEGLAAILHGVKLFKQLGLNFAHIECDIMEEVRILNGNAHVPSHLNQLVQVIHDVLKLDIHACFLHIACEGNKCADKMARMALRVRRVMHVLHVPPTELHPLLVEDTYGILHAKAQSLILTFIYSKKKKELILSKK